MVEGRSLLHILCSGVAYFVAKIGLVSGRNWINSFDRNWPTLFYHSQLDPIEGIWFSWRTIIILKTSAMDTIKDLKDYDYLLVEYSNDPQKAEIFGVRKTQTSHIFSYGKWDRSLRQISPTALVWAEHSYQSPESLFITRIYPSDSK
jgi:hypothetical protein